MLIFTRTTIATLALFAAVISTGTGTGLPACPAEPLCVDYSTADGTFTGSIIGTMPQE